MMPSPMPGTPCVPHRSSEISGHSAGSTAKTRTAGSCAFSARATPLIHPPVPCAATTASSSPPVCSQISSPEARCAAGLSGFSNSAGTKNRPGSAATISRILSMARSMSVPAPGVSTSSAP